MCADAQPPLRIRTRVRRAASLSLHVSDAPFIACARAGEMQEPSKRAAQAIVKQQDTLVEELTHGHPF